MHRIVTIAGLAAAIALGSLLWPGPARSQNRAWETEIRSGDRRSNSPYHGRRNSSSDLREQAREKLKQEQREREAKERQQAEARRTGGYRVEGGPDRSALIQREASDDYLRKLEELEQARTDARNAARKSRKLEPPSYWRRMLGALRDVPVSLSMIGLGLLVGLLIGLRVRPRH